MNRFINSISVHIKHGSKKSLGNYLETTKYDFLDLYRPKFEHAKPMLFGYRKIMLHSDDMFNIYFLRWSKNSLSPLHGHFGKQCVFTVVNGAIKENRFDTKTKRKGCINFIHKGNSGFINDNIGLHEMINIGPGVTHTLHIYTDYRYYN